MTEDRIFAISAVTGANTESVVRSVRQVLKDLPEDTETETNARNLQKPLRSSTTPQIEDFVIRAQKDITPRQYVVAGEAIELFTSMTNWTYYEAYRRCVVSLADGSGCERVLQFSAGFGSFRD